MTYKFILKMIIQLQAVRDRILSEIPVDIKENDRISSNNEETLNVNVEATSDHIKSEDDTTISNNESEVNNDLKDDEV